MTAPTFRIDDPAAIGDEPDQVDIVLPVDVQTLRKLCYS
jgi:hypothetical protein